MIMYHRACACLLFPILAIGFMEMSVATAAEIHDAAKADDLRRVEAAIAAGANVEDLDPYMGSPLHIAVARGAIDIVKLLIGAGADIEAMTKLSQGQSRPLHIAARANRPKIAALLMEHGAKLESRDQKGATPLMVAAATGNTDVAVVLLQAGANPVAEESTYHDTPIYVAAMNGHLDIVKLLLANGIDVNLRNTHTGETPLWVAAMDSRLAVMEYLLANGADPNIADNSGKAPIHVGREPKVKDLLRKFGARE